jgi:hypothetical protein
VVENELGGVAIRIQDARAVGAATLAGAAAVAIAALGRGAMEGLDGAASGARNAICTRMPSVSSTVA